MNNLVKPVPPTLEARRVEMDSTWSVPPTLQSYDPTWANQQSLRPSQYIVVDTPPLPQTMSGPFELMARSMQNIFQMQMAMLRQLDVRLNRLEQTRPPQFNTGEFYAQTWWALWGILMLILGAALVMVLTLILRG
ncbi:MAG: hypothetical protein HY741_05440 [Chloroflexi bacterium]|nr:hypothetical protein [Chloroflexota bacterium]